MKKSFGSAMLALTVASQLAVGAERVPSAVSPQTVTDASGDRELVFDYAVTRLVSIVLPPHDTAVKRQEPTRGGPFDIGFHRQLPPQYSGNFAERLYWLPGDGDTIVGALSLRSPGAAAVRVALRVRNLGDGEIRFFGEPGNSRYVPIGRADLSAEELETRTIWSPVVDGDVVGVEVVLPSAEALSAFSLIVEKISHIHTLPQSSADLSKEADCANHIDVQCRDDVVHDGWEDAVAKIVFEVAGRTFACSGTLLNDSDDGSFIPYFLTAGHCVSSQLVANTVAASWFYQRAMCGDGETDSRLVHTAGGADLLATSRDQDASLLRLMGRLPGGLTFAGWSAERLDHPADVYGIHHPGGGIKKYSAGATTGNVEEYLGLPTFNGITADWYEGLTEGGSSGSGLFRRDDGSLVGTLSGGERGCWVATDVYGTFADFFPSVRRWLAPQSGVADDHGDTPESAAPVLIGGVRRGRLESGVDIDYFRIELASAGAIRVWTAGTTDTVGVLFREDGRVRIEDDNGGEDTNFLIAATLPAGTYYIEVSGYAEAKGDYALEVSFDAFAAGGDHGDLRIEATDVAVPSETDGELEWGGDLDYFRIELEKPGTLRARTSGDTDTTGALLDHNGVLLAVDDDSGAGPNFYIRRDLEAGSYYVEVGGFDVETTGEYVLEIEFAPVDEDDEDDDHGDTAESATVATVPSIERGSIERDGDVDYFRVELVEAATLWLETTGGVDTDGALIAEDGTTLREDDRAGAELLIADDVEAGTYYVAVRGAGEETTGDYELSIRSNATGRSGTFHEAVDVEVPSSTEGELEWEERDHYRFELAEAGPVRVETTGGTDTVGRLLDEHGNRLAEDNDGGEWTNFKIEQFLASGTYYVEVRGYFGGTGPYTLEISLQEAFSPDAVDIKFPSSTEGGLEAGERDYYRFELAEAVPVRVETTGGTDTVGRLLDEHGNRLAEDDDGGEWTNFKIEQFLASGTYYVEVREFFGGTGPYTLEISLGEAFSPDAVDIEFPSSTEGELEAEERDYYRFELAEAVPVRVETTGGTDTVERLLDEHGNRLAKSYDGGEGLNFRIERFLAPGTYYVEVRGFSTGAYVLDVSSGVTAVTANSSTPGKIADVGAQDYFRVDLPEPGELLIGTAGDTDTVGALLDQHGKVLAENDDGGEGFNFRIVRVLHPGTYYAVVRGYHFTQEIGAYSLEVGFMPKRQPRRFGDFDGDGATDVLLRHRDGRWSIRGVDGRRQTYARTADPTRNRQWRLAALADLNGDDRDDVILRHADGRWMYHAMNGHRSQHDDRGALNLTRGANWRIAGSGDFDGDGKDDLLLRNVDGRWRYYRMDGRVGAVALSELPVELEWHLAGIGDLDGNGSDELLLRDTDGAWRYYHIDEDGRWAGREVDLANDPSKRVAGIGDLNGDGNDDVLLREMTGRWEYRPMNGHRAIATGSGRAEIPSNPIWRLAGIGDLNGDGNDDVLLRHANGQWRYVAMAGSRAISGDTGEAALPRDLLWSIPPLLKTESSFADTPSMNARDLKKERGGKGQSARP